MADLNAIVTQLKQERAKLDKAIAALSGLLGNPVVAEDVGSLQRRVQG
ncbi:MAG TPA: hypothetical protein VMG82_20350 [Candidatus Sulfotelmatobacter sp.]|nr:hypothetical protein [Candidatus Sulfotelmatobacter sp.]